MYVINNSNKKAVFVSRAIIIVEDSLLVCESPDKSYYYLPGGHVEFCESVKDALLREIEEETKETGKIIKYLGYIECNFLYENDNIFELGHYFLAEIPKIKYPETPAAYEKGLTFKWMNINDITSSNIKPNILKSYLPEYINGNKEIWNFNSIET